MTEPRRRPRRARARSEAAPIQNGDADGGVENTAAPAMVTPEAPVFLYRQPAPVAVRVDATALTHPELSDLARALSEPSLGFLLLEVVREVRRRLASTCEAGDGEEEGRELQAPHPVLARALRTVLSELAENDG